MNILLDKLPTTVKIGGSDFAINADFRTSFLFEEIMENEEVEEMEKAFELLQIYYPVLPPKENIEEAFDKIIWFYKCDEDIKASGKETTFDRIHSYKYDSKHIYSAFLEQYSLDLQEIEYLHWWKFKALFEGLNEETKIKKIMLYRSINLKDIKEETQKEFYKEMKELYKLPGQNKNKRDKKIIDETLNKLMGYQ